MEVHGLFGEIGIWGIWGDLIYIKVIEMKEGFEESSDFLKK
jgi:hypothetical protein